MPARNPVLADHVEERKTTIVMTKEERLAALKALLEGLREPLVYVDGDIAERTESWGVKPIPSVPGWMIKDLCLCVPGCEYNLVKSNDGVDCCLVLQSEKGNNNFQAAHHTRVRAIRWAQAEIAKLEQPGAEPLEWGSEGAPGWCNKKPKEVIEAAAADGSAMDAAESLLDREQMRREVVDSINKSPFQLTAALNHLFKALDAGYAKDEEIARLSGFEKIASAMQEDIENLQEEVANYSTAPLIIKDLQKDLESARFQCAAKDEEIAALKRENEVMLQQHLSRDKAVTETRLKRDAYIEQLENDVKRLSERLNERKEEIRTLNGVIAGQVQDFAAMEASRDEYKALYQEALAAAERQREDLESKSMSYDAWQRRCLLFAVREGDAARILGTDNKWVYGFTVATKAPLECILVDRYGNQHKVDTDDIGKKWDSLYKADNEHKRYEYAAEPKAGQPATRTAADAKVNDPVWFDCNGGIFDGYITAISADNRIHMMANDNSAFTHWTSSAFGIRWGYAEEEAK